MNTSYMKIGLTLMALAGSLTGCVEETFPNSSYMTSDQVEQQPDAMQGYVNAITGMLGKADTYSSSISWDIGYLGVSLMRDVYCNDFPVYKNSYDYFSYWSDNMYLGEYSTAQYPWFIYYKLVSNCHNVLRLTPNSETMPFFGIAHFFRAYFYFDMARMYEFKTTGFPEIDNEAEANDIYGLTVPLITENTTEEEARNTPRATFYDTYRFILDDLDMAAEMLEGYNRPNKSVPNVSVVNGMRARVYLDMATRFEQNPDQLAQYTASGVDLGVKSAQEAYEKALEYADLAIMRSGSTPLTEKEWYGGEQYKDGFNNINTSAWLLGASINRELLSSSSWKSFIAFISPETYYGIAGIDYNPSAKSDKERYTNTYTTQRLIDTRLYESIPAADWRKKTWIDPADAGNPTNVSKYPTSVDPWHFAQIPAYTGIKFRPRDGERSDYSVGSAADFPLMRVEEMYFIKAEALACAHGVGEGVSALESFMNTWRYTDGSYKCKVSSLDDFRTELIRNKRIELWGEGQIFFDYKRLNIQIVRGYTGTNFTESSRLNSIAGYCAPWLTTYIMHSEIGINPAMKPNPDPSIVDALWYGN